ncbi:hypothetical protein DRO66_00535 [Candidatus Bathyarchaeota archaeon]|nr:MAG: hypothetical protein DRO66_00535 [Candidatus Bathyarchaeota archaeon]
MLRISIDMNGQNIGTIDVLQVGNFDDSDLRSYEYSYLVDEEVLAQGLVTHKRNEDATALLMAVTSHIQAEHKDELPDWRDRERVRLIKKITGH